jgi:predicted ATPase/DNA-binding CsgD family transcriptional regulator
MVQGPILIRQTYKVHWGESPRALPPFQDLFILRYWFSPVEADLISVEMRHKKDVLRTPDVHRSRYVSLNESGTCRHLWKIPYCHGGLHVMQERSLISREGKAIASKARFSLPIPLTSFVGREQEIATVCALLRRSEIRLLTLIGTGGVGKTRLALQVATRLSKDFADQVYIISLMETSDPELVVSTIAKTLGLQELGNQPILDLLKAFLKENQLLLLLDNFEQVIEAAPALTDLLATCSGLKILVTSRERLRISGEQTFFVPPLALPDLAQLPEKEALILYPAITFFLERARMVLPEFILNEENARIVAEICIHLDGLPLAIELAVPRLRVLSLQTLLERLDHRLQVLIHGMRDAPGRQQTLQNTLEWSYRLLNPQEQQLFRFLSVFVGGCTLQAIETIWELAGHLQEKELVLEAVASLLDKSMLYRSTQEAEEPRLLLLRTVREYGLQRLTLTGELERIQWAHATYYLALAEEAKLQLRGPLPHPWLERLQREHENLREALCFLIAHGEKEASIGTEMALRLGKALERFWMIGGHVKEGRDLLERALKRSREVSPSIRGYALCILAILARYQGDYGAAEAAGEESLATFRELDDPSGIANALYRLGYVAWMRGDPGTARMCYEESLAISGREQYREQCKDARSETLYYSAYLAFFQRETQLARLLIEESLDLSRELGDQYNIASALNLLGWILLLQEDIAAARTLQEESLKANRELGNQRGIAHTQCALGEIAYRRGDFAQACERYEEGLALLMWLDDRLMVAIYLERLASVAVALGEAIWAVHLLSAAQALRQVMGASMTTPLERDAREETLTTLHNLLDEQVFAAVWEKGQAMSPEQAVAARALSTQATALSAGVKSPMRNMHSPDALHENLTPREREVLRLVAQGLTDAQVAQRLVISPRTVNFHLSSIYRKLEVSSRSAATRYALEYHLFLRVCLKISKSRAERSQTRQAETKRSDVEHAAPDADVVYRRAGL